ncbi:MAG: hypothetical protein WC647_09260 [Desulfomonilaceae bacterium]|jgi:cell division protein FtsI/penicillin-binding protein 2
MERLFQIDGSDLVAHFSSDRVPQDYYKYRITVFSIVVWAVMAALLIRLWNLQLMMGESFDDMAIENRIRLLRLPPPRGSILDVNGDPLAENKQFYFVNSSGSNQRLTGDCRCLCGRIGLFS